MSVGELVHELWPLQEFLLKKNHWNITCSRTWEIPYMSIHWKRINVDISVWKYYIIVWKNSNSFILHSVNEECMKEIAMCANIEQVARQIASEGKVQRDNVYSSFQKDYI